MITLDLVWYKNVIYVAIAVHFAWIAIGHEVADAGIDHEFEGLAGADHDIGFEAFENWVIFARDEHLPWLFW